MWPQTAKKSWVKSTLLENVMWMSPKIFLVMQHLWQSQWGIGRRGVPRSTYQKTLPPLTVTTSDVIVTRGRLGLGAGNCRFVGKIYKLFQTLFTVLCSVGSFLVPRERVPRPNCIIKCKLWLWKEYDFMFYTLSSRPLLYTFLSERKKMFSATRINNLT